MTKHSMRVYLIIGGIALSCFLPSKTLQAQDQRSSPAKANFTHQLTIFVDEGHGKLNGHVWIGIGSRDSSNTSYHGFYPQRPYSVPEVWEPGEVRDDSQHVQNGEWDVKRTYNITKEDYAKALEAINAWQNKDKTRWDGLTHCGDFTEGIARAAGVGLTMPWTYKGNTRPAAFGTYLRKRGGVVNNEKPEKHRNSSASIPQSSKATIPTGSTASPGWIPCECPDEHKNLARLGNPSSIMQIKNQLYHEPSFKGYCKDPSGDDFLGKWEIVDGTGTFEIVLDNKGQYRVLDIKGQDINDGWCVPIIKRTGNNQLTVHIKGKGASGAGSPGYGCASISVTYTLIPNPNELKMIGKTFDEDENKYTGEITARKIGKRR